MAVHTTDAFHPPAGLCPPRYHRVPHSRSLSHPATMAAAERILELCIVRDVQREGMSLLVFSSVSVEQAAPVWILRTGSHTHDFANSLI